MTENVLKTTIREEFGTTAMNRLRKSGWVPAIVYGKKSESVAVQINKQELVHFLHSLSSEHALMKLKIKNKNENVMIKDIQYHPYKNFIHHIDFHKVSLDEKITTSVAVEEVGEAKGLLSGGIIEHSLRELRIECYPQDIPTVIEIDITELEIGDSIHVGEITPPKGVRFLDDPEQSVISLIAPKVETEETEETGELGEEVSGSAPEPELIRKRPKAEDEE
ncbi:50S ribosomal protein L25 [bacterium]|nr:50S ribosomal protein L25 [bacterium]MCP5462785.1 50S ribosomal protein L25 [bacterium]